MVVFLGWVALTGCEQLPQASVAPQAVVSDALPTPTVAQQAWLNFVAKVRRGEQADPTGQYVQDGTILPAAAERGARPKLDAARDTYPFRLRPDGTVVLLPQTAPGSAGAGSKEYTGPDPVFHECPGPDCPNDPTHQPTMTSTFMHSTGLGGSGVVVDLKIDMDKPSRPGYVILDADLNKGAGGKYIYLQFTRDPNSVVQGIEYWQNASGYRTSDGEVRFTTANGSSGGNLPNIPPWFWPVFGHAQNSSALSQVDLNAGAGGEYIYAYASKDAAVRNPGGTVSYYVPFAEVGILSGNSDQIQPPAGWLRDPHDLNEGAGGDYIYFCYKL